MPGSACIQHFGEVRQNGFASADAGVIGTHRCRAPVCSSPRLSGPPARRSRSSRPQLSLRARRARHVEYPRLHSGRCRCGETSRGPWSRGSCGNSPPIVAPIFGGAPPAALLAIGPSTKHQRRGVPGIKPRIAHSLPASPCCARQAPPDPPQPPREPIRPRARKDPWRISRPSANRSCRDQAGPA